MAHPTFTEAWQLQRFQTAKVAYGVTEGHSRSLVLVLVPF